MPIANSKHKYIIRDPKNREEFIFIDDIVQREKTENTIREMNQNSNLGFDLLTPYNKNIRKNAHKELGKGYWIDNYMSEDYHGDNIILSFSGYPHDEAGDFLTDITFTSNKYNVFGIKPGDDFFISKKMLKKQGLKKKRTVNVYKKDDLYIHLTEDDYYGNGDKTKIGTITVNVETFYLGNRIY